MDPTIRAPHVARDGLAPHIVVAAELDPLTRTERKTWTRRSPQREVNGRLRRSARDSEAGPGGFGGPRPAP